MHNKLRRDIEKQLASEGVMHPLGAQEMTALLARALTALGGPVNDNRPTVEGSVIEATPEAIPATTPDPTGYSTIEPNYNN